MRLPFKSTKCSSTSDACQVWTQQIKHQLQSKMGEREGGREGGKGKDDGGRDGCMHW